MSEASAESILTPSGLELTGAEIGAALRSLGERPVTEHPAVFEQIHAELQTALNRLDGA